MITTSDELLDELAKPLPIEDTFIRKQSGQELTYVSNEATIRWLNKHIGVNWSFTINSYTLERHPTDTSKGSPQFMAIVQGSLEVFDPEHTDDLLARRDGIGAGVNQDPDTAVKTAQAEALKKASNQFGVALYLWQPESREKISVLKSGSVTVMQDYLVDNAIRGGADGNSESVALYYRVTPKDLTNIGVLQELIEQL